MDTVSRLLTSVDVDDRAGDRISVSARHELELTDGSRVLLLDDRGWGESGRWDMTSVEDGQRTARMVVGPDEPFGDLTQEDMAADHWDHLSRIAREQGIAVDGADLRLLPHDVLLSRQLLTRVGAHPDDNSA